MTTLAGVRIAPDGTAVDNAAFDVTPSDLVTSFVTDEGVLTASQIAGWLAS